MAKTKEWKPRRVNDESERGGSSGFIKLDEKEKFLGYALFTGDPKKREPGYYEFLQHWVTGPKGYSVPCAGDDCPVCEDGEKPRDVALTLWLVIEDEHGNELGDGKGELRIFQMNSLVIKQFTEMRLEGSKIKGRQFRIIRADDRGTYTILPKDKYIKGAQIKELVKSNDAPDFDRMTTTKLRKAMEGLAIARAMNDDDDDDNEDKEDSMAGTKKGKGGKGKGGSKKKAQVASWPSEGDDEVVTVVKADDDNFVTVTSDEYEEPAKAKLWGTPSLDVTEFEKGDEIIVSWVTDEDEDFVLTDATKGEDADEDGGGDDDDETEIDGEDFEIVKIKKKDDCIVVERNDEEVELYANDEIDLSDFSKGDAVTVSADWTLEDEDDEDSGYWLLSSMEAAEEGDGGGDEEDGDESELPDAIEDETFTVTEINEAESTLDVEGADGDLSFTLYFLDQGPASEVDFDDYKVGDKIIVSAEKDSVGDMVATKVPKAKGSKKSSGSKKSAGKKTTDKKSDKKKSGGKSSSKAKTAGKKSGKKASGGKSSAKKKGGKKK